MSEVEERFKRLALLNQERLELEHLKLVHLMNALQPLRGYFKSGNEIPVSRTVILKKDWDPIETILKEIDALWTL